MLLRCSLFCELFSLGLWKLHVEFVDVHVVIYGVIANGKSYFMLSLFFFPFVVVTPIGRSGVRSSWTVPVILSAATVIVVTVPIAVVMRRMSVMRLSSPVFIFHWVWSSPMVSVPVPIILSAVTMSVSISLPLALVAHNWYIIILSFKRVKNDR